LIAKKEEGESSLLRELEDLTKSVKILSPTEYDFREQVYSIFGSSESNVQEPQTLAKYFTASLGGLFYRVYHCRQTASLAGNWGGIYQGPFFDAKSFMEYLSGANTGTGTLESGWEVRRIEKDGMLAVLKDALTLWVPPHLFFHEQGKRKTVQIGTKGMVQIAKESRALLPGFYLAYGNAPLEDGAIKTTVRLYWNVGAESAVALLMHVTSELNKDNIPFRFKTLSSPNAYVRADSAVLYISKQHLARSKNALSRIYEQARKIALKPPTPLFAKRLAPGVALAEDPNNGESFGQHRSRILAESIYLAYEKGLSSTEERISEIEAYFKSLGLNIDRAYLNSGSTDDYGTMLQGIFD
jgi:hypothetical protein